MNRSFGSNPKKLSKAEMLKNVARKQKTWIDFALSIPPYNLDFKVGH